MMQTTCSVPFETVVGSGSQKSDESSSSVAAASQAEKSEKSGSTSRIEVSWKTAGVCVRDTAPLTMIRPVNSRCESTALRETNNAVFFFGGCLSDRQTTP